MKTLTILLSDSVYQVVLAKAIQQNVDAATLCSVIVAEHFPDARKVSAAVAVEKSTTILARSNRSEPTTMFDVKKHFPNYPTRSIELAQQFVGEALAVSGAKAFKADSERGIGIEPNFVFVEYLQRRPPGGIGVSFYGRPEDHLHPSLLRPGRNPNYSRSIVCTQEGLKPLLEEIRRSHELKFGPIR
jgi:hypothetical protein